MDWRLLVLFVSLGAAQGPNISEAKPAPVSSAQSKPEVRKQVGKTKPYQIGTASWYGENFDGKPTASGEPYEMYDMTAAHLTLPLGSYVRVTNLRNGKAVVVRVNDRGPIVPGRIIDLSYGAAASAAIQGTAWPAARASGSGPALSNAGSSRRPRLPDGCRQPSPRGGTPVKTLHWLGCLRLYPTASRTVAELSRWRFACDGNDPRRMIRASGSSLPWTFPPPPPHRRSWRRWETPR